MWTMIDNLKWLMPIFRKQGLVVEHKRFPADYMWRQFIDLTDDVAAAVQPAQDTADQALELAQGTETNLNTVLYQRWHVHGDELEWSAFSGYGVTYSSVFPYGVAGYSTNQNSAAHIQFVGIAGTWEIKLLLPKLSNVGKHDIVLDGVTLQSNYDQYAASPVYGNVLTLSGITIANSGVHDLYIINTGKNVSSSGYSIAVCKAWGLVT